MWLGDRECRECVGSCVRVAGCGRVIRQAGSDTGSCGRVIKQAGSVLSRVAGWQGDREGWEWY